jgi:hypothetical protein
MPRKAYVHRAVGVEMHIVAPYLRGAQGKTASWRVQASIGHLLRRVYPVTSVKTRIL